MTTKLTEAKLKRFIKVRNKSGHNSNIQFGIDARECGFDVKELGKARVVGNSWYVWETPYGILTERWGAMFMKD